ncbi:MAG: hypothetical protein J6S09_04475 [Paludibacteraceae bacterium]|nr:hypothetical protein [Paludibacteraceae bacterium]
MEATIENCIPDFSSRVENYRRKDPLSKEIDIFEKEYIKISKRLEMLKRALKDNYFCYAKLFGEGWRYELPSLSAISMMQTFPEESIEARVYSIIVRMRNLMRKGRDDEEMRKISIVFLDIRRNLDDIDTSLMKINEDYRDFWNGWYERKQNQHPDPLSDWYKERCLQTEIKFH